MLGAVSFNNWRASSVNMWTHIAQTADIILVSVWIMMTEWSSCFMSKRTLVSLKVTVRVIITFHRSCKCASASRRLWAVTSIVVNVVNLSLLFWLILSNSNLMIKWDWFIHSRWALFKIFIHCSWMWMIKMKMVLRVSWIIINLLMLMMITRTCGLCKAFNKLFSSHCCLHCAHGSLNFNFHPISFL